MKVRIALAIDPTGRYSACGYTCADQDDLWCGVADDLAQGERRYWVEVVVPVPTGPETVTGTATEAKP